jgi:hypothetical protein
LPPATVSAVYKPDPVPDVKPGYQLPEVVHLTNTGATAWVASGPQAVSLTYHLLTLQGDPWKPLSPFSPGVVAFGQGATSLGHDVLPGHVVTVRVPLQAPVIPGSYRIVWDLHEGADLWFSQLGVLSRTQTLNVVMNNVVAQTSTATAIATPAPLEGLRFVADTSIADGSLVPAGGRFAKGWLVYNNGSIGWHPGWSLHLVAGKAFGAKTIPVPTLSACRTLNLVAQMRAPSKTGGYRSVWQLRDGENRWVGDRLTLVVAVVKGGPSSTPLPTPVVSPTTSLPTPTPTPVG